MGQRNLNDTRKISIELIGMKIVALCSVYNTPVIFTKFTKGIFKVQGSCTLQALHPVWFTYNLRTIFNSSSREHSISTTWEVFLAVMLLEPLTLSLVPRKIIMNYINYYLQSAHDSYICGFIHCRTIWFNYIHCSPNESVDICLWPLLTNLLITLITHIVARTSQLTSVYDHSLQLTSVLWPLLTNLPINESV